MSPSKRPCSELVVSVGFAPTRRPHESASYTVLTLNSCPPVSYSGGGRRGCGVLDTCVPVLSPNGGVRRHPPPACVFFSRKGRPTSRPRACDLRRDTPARVFGRPVFVLLPQDVSVEPFSRWLLWTPQRGVNATGADFVLFLSNPVNTRCRHMSRGKTQTVILRGFTRRPVIS